MIKICGITTEEALYSCIKMHVDMVGFVFYEYSSRNININRASVLSDILPANIEKVAVMVNPSLQSIEKVVNRIKPDYIQLDNAKGVEEILEIKKYFDVKIIKTIYISKNSKDICKWCEYDGVADYILFDAQPNNELFIENSDDTFNWSLLRGMEIKTPWILSGGLNRYNVIKALDCCDASCVNASSTLEITPGVKDPALIESFVKTARQFYIKHAKHT